MDTTKLSINARRLIGQELNIFDKESPIIKSAKAFNERALLYIPYKYIGKLIQIYNDEKEKFDTEKDYLDFLEEQEIKLYEYIDKLIEYSDDFKQSIRYEPIKIDVSLCTDVYNVKFIDTTMLEILPLEGIYDILKFELMDGDKLPNTVYDFIYSITKSKFLAERKRIDLNRLSAFSQNILNRASNELAFAVFKEACDVISSKQLISVGDGKVVFSVATNVSVNTLKKVNDVINSTILVDNVNLTVNVYNLRRLSMKSNMLIKRYIDSTMQLVNGTEFDRIAYFRFLRQEELTENDLVFDINGMSCKMLKAVDMNWITNK